MTNLLCYFGLHDWRERKQRGGGLAWRYKHYRCGRVGCYEEKIGDV